jgi:hypothetical protein
MNKLTLLSFVVAGLFSTATIAETISGAVGGSAGKATGTVTGGAVGGGVGAGAGAVEGTLKAPSTGAKSASKCFNKTGLPILCASAGILDTAVSPVQGVIKGTTEGALKGSGN